MKELNDDFDEMSALLIKCKAQSNLMIVENKRLRQELDILKAKLKVYESEFQRKGELNAKGI